MLTASLTSRALAGSRFGKREAAIDHSRLSEEKSRVKIPRDVKHAGEIAVLLQYPHPRAVFVVGRGPPAPDPARLAAHSDTTLYFGCRDVDAAHAELRLCKVGAREPIVTDYGMKQVYLRDPEGYEICQQRVDAAHAV